MYHIKHDKRSIQSCNRIYNALKEILILDDFSNITITDVVAKAEVARATFYRNFDHLDDVFRFEIDNKFEELYQYLKIYYQTEPKYFMSFFITPFLKFWYLDSTIIELLIKSEHINILIEAFENLLKRGIDEYDGVDPIIIENLNYFLALRAGIAISVLLKWIENKKKEEPEELIKLLCRQMQSSMHLDMFK